MFGAEGILGEGPAGGDFKADARRNEMDGDLANRAQAADLTRILAERVCAVSYDGLPEAVRDLARQCVLDYYGVALAGADDKLATILPGRGWPKRAVRKRRASSAAGRGCRRWSAALVNGAKSATRSITTTSIWRRPGHPSVAILPALLALAEQRHSSGRDVIAAFVAGYETACRIGTAAQSRAITISASTPPARLAASGAAAACARLVGLDAERPRRARSASPGPRRPGSNRNCNDV